MAKIKFDRSINILAKDNETTRVPNDEVWKGTLATRYSGAEVKINETTVAGGSGSDRAIPMFTTLGGALQSKVLSLALLSQVSHLKSFLNIFAKGVSLA